MNKLKNWLNNLLIAPTRAIVLREIDRAIAKIDAGVGQAELDKIIADLEARLISAFRAKLPSGIGDLLMQIVLSNPDWSTLSSKSIPYIKEFLRNLRHRVEGARL